jgi:hypothetical protein
MDRTNLSSSNPERRGGTRRSSLAACWGALGALALGLSYLPSLACFPRIEIILDGEAEITTARLNPNLVPYGSQAPRPGPFYSDGNRYDSGTGHTVASGTELLSELYFSSIFPSKLTQLHRSKCFWVEQEAENPVISYETIFHDVEIPELEQQWEQLSICSNGVHDPRTRAPLTLDEGEGRRLHHYELDLDDLDVLLTAHQGGNGDPHRSCELGVDVEGDGQDDAGDAMFDPSNLPARVFLMSNATPLGGNSFPPLCMIKGATPPVNDDTSYSLELVDVPVGKVMTVEETVVAVSPTARFSTEPHHLEPRVKVVGRGTHQNPFTIVRPLTWRDETPDIEGDETKVRQHWSWQVPIDHATGMWHENFSYNLEVTQVKIFRGTWDDAHGVYQRTYLRPSRIKVYLGEYDDPLKPRAENCHPEGDDNGEPAVCELRPGFTPTYAHATPSQWLTWVPQFRQVILRRPCTASDGMEGVCEDVLEDTFEDSNASLFIEFTLARSGEQLSSTQSGLTASPVNGGHFGNVEVADRPSLEDAFWLDNLGSDSIQVEEIGFEGPDAAHFSARVTGAPGLPFAIAPGSAVSISLDFFSQSMYVHTATLYVSTRNAQGEPEEIRLQVSASAVDYIFHALHPYLGGFVRLGKGYAQVDDFDKPLWLINSGNIGMPRGEIRIEGFNADAFSVVRETPLKSDPLSGYIPWYNGETPPARWTISPGLMEALRVIYHPRGGYRDEARSQIPDVAELVVPIEDQEYRFPLAGRCAGDCDVSGPKVVDPGDPPTVCGGTSICGGGGGGNIGRDVMMFSK